MDIVVSIPQARMDKLLLTYTQQQIESRITDDLFDLAWGSDIARQSAIIRNEEIELANQRTGQRIQAYREGLES